MKGQTKEYLKLNKNILLGFFTSVTISAMVSQVLFLQAKYINSSATLAVDLSVYYATFSILFYLDNRHKYLTDFGQLDKSRLKKDLLRVITSLGIGEIVYVICRWFLHYYFLTMNYQPYLSSALAQSISFVIYLACVNLTGVLVKLYKE